MTVPGVRNNNPGNIRHSPNFTWQGEVGIDYRGLVIFDTPENGIRALLKTLLTYFRAHGLRTVDEIIARYAPPNENDTEAYQKDVARSMGVMRDEPLDLTKKLTLIDMGEAVTVHENGVNPYTLAQFGAEADLVLAA